MCPSVAALSEDTYKAKCSANVQFSVTNTQRAAGAPHCTPTQVSYSHIISTAGKKKRNRTCVSRVYGGKM